MGKGKIAAQVGHAVQYVTEHMIRNHPIKWRQYKMSGMAKIVLRVTEETLLMLIAKYPDRCTHVIDAGHTQIAAGSMTVVGFYPGDPVEEIVCMKLL